MKKLFRLYIKNIFLLRPLYRVRSSENSINVVVLSFVTLMFNLITIVVHLAKFVGLKMQLPNLNMPLSFYGYAVGAIGSIIYLIIVSYIGKQVNKNDKRIIFRQSIKSMKSVWFSIFYILVTLFLFALTMIEIIR